MFGVSVLSLLFVVVVVGVSLSLMAWLLAGIPELQTRPIRLVTDLDLRPEPDPEPVIDLRQLGEPPLDPRSSPDPSRPTDALCP